MNAQQLEEILNRVVPAAVAAAAPPQPAQGTQTRRMTVLSSSDPSEWRIWRANYEALAAANNWDAPRQRHVLRTHFDGAAFEATRGVAITEDVAIPDILAALELCFVPAAASSMARSEFAHAQQLPTESLMQWKARLRNLFVRAFPQIPAADVDSDIMLKETFMEGLADGEIRGGLCDRLSHMNTIDDCLQAAQTRTASSARIQKKFGTGGTGGAKLHTVGDSTAALAAAVAAATLNQLGRCWNCEKEGHFKGDCPELRRGPRSGRGRGRGTPKGGRGRGTGRPRGRGGNRTSSQGNKGRKLNQLSPDDPWLDEAAKEAEREAQGDQEGAGNEPRRA